MKMAMLSSSCIMLSFLFCLCSPSPFPDDWSLNEDKLIGKWSEIADKVALKDSIGITIDSIDVSAVYEFFPDNTFTCVNEVWMETTYGVWKIDSTETNIYLYPNILTLSAINPGAGYDESWHISNLNSEYLDVEHTHEYYSLNDTVAILLYRLFYKID